MKRYSVTVAIKSKTKTPYSITPSLLECLQLKRQHTPSAGENEQQREFPHAGHENVKWSGARVHTYTDTVKECSALEHKEFCRSWHV